MNNDFANGISLKLGKTGAKNSGPGGNNSGNPISPADAPLHSVSASRRSDCRFRVDVLENLEQNIFMNGKVDGHAFSCRALKSS